MTWNAFHSRGEILRELAELAAQRRDGRLPHRLPDGTPVVPGAFADELDVLGAVLLAWHAGLSGNIERELGNQPMDLEAAVVRAWARTADARPGLRLIADQYLAHPVDDQMARVLRRAQHKERAGLAAAAGLAFDEGPAAVEAGHRLETAARGLRRSAAPTPTPDALPTPAAPAQGPTPGSLAERIKAALAAA